MQNAYARKKKNKNAYSEDVVFALFVFQLRDSPEQRENYLYSWRMSNAKIIICNYNK